MKTSAVNRSAPLVAVIGSILLLTACGGKNEAGPTGSGTAGGGPQIERVEEHVDYYGACGNEILTLADATWYPLLPDERDKLDVDAYPLPTAGGVDPSSLRSAIMVVAPGPGDDTGTLVVYSDGLARFESDSGDLVTWLTSDHRTYNWVC